MRERTLTGEHPNTTELIMEGIYVKMKDGKEPETKVSSAERNH